MVRLQLLSAWLQVRRCHVPTYRSMFPPNIIMVAGRPIRPILETMTLQSQAALAGKQWAQRCKHLRVRPQWLLVAPLGWPILEDLGPLPATQYSTCDKPRIVDHLATLFHGTAPDSGPAA